MLKTVLRRAPGGRGHVRCSRSSATFSVDLTKLGAGVEHPLGSLSVRRPAAHRDGSRWLLRARQHDRATRTTTRPASKAMRKAGARPTARRRSSASPSRRGRRRADEDGPGAPKQREEAEPTMPAGARRSSTCRRARAARARGAARVLVGPPPFALVGARARSSISALVLRASSRCACACSSTPSCAARRRARRGAHVRRRARPRDDAARARRARRGAREGDVLRHRQARPRRTRRS